MNFKNKLKGIREIWHFDNRWQLLLTRFFFSDEKINIYRYKGLEILIDHYAGDSNGAREVLTSDMYRRFINRMKLREKNNILDLGTNNGGFPLLLKSENIEISKLVCVELNPQTFSRMKFNIDRNFDCEAHLLNAAVSGENKHLQIEFGVKSTSDNIYRNKSERKEDLQTIEGLTFNELFKRTFKDEIVDICKIDIEGAEFEIFANDECSLITKCRYVLIEIHHEPGFSREVIRDKFNELGFTELQSENKSDELHYVHFFQNKNLARDNAKFSNIS